MRILVTKILVIQLNESKVEDLKLKKLLNQEDDAESIYDHSFQPIRIDIDKVSGYKPTMKAEKIHGRKTTDIILDGMLITIDVDPEDFFKIWTAGMETINLDKNLNIIENGK